MNVLMADAKWRKGQREAEKNPEDPYAPYTSMRLTLYRNASRKRIKST